MIRYILLPGRHHVLTQFQVDHLHEVFKTKQTKSIDNETIAISDETEVVWAISSANHSNTRRNPIPGYRRLGMVEYVTQKEGVPSLNFLIQDIAFKTDFAHYVIEEINLQSNGAVHMTPSNTVVACSTPPVIEQYQKLGFHILPLELEDMRTNKIFTPRAWEMIEEIAEVGESWAQSEFIQQHMAGAAVTYFQKYQLDKTVIDIFKDPLQEASGDGDLTESRDYDVYRQAFEDNAFRKVEQFSQYVVPGRIVDVGSATGQTIKLLTEIKRLEESDFYGVEAARPLYAICQQRKENGAFGNANVFFYQRNIMQSTLFPPKSVDTVITMALTHEVESYMGREALEQFIERVYQMTAPGGAYINYDVVGPDDKDKQVYVQLTEDDGENPDDVHIELDDDKLKDFLETLSSKSRFIRFAADFRASEGDTMSYSTETIDGVEYFVMRYADLCDYLAKKDYVENWHSELHERFAYWEYSDWTQALEGVGFEIEPGSKPITNEWLIENRFAPAARVFERGDDGTLTELGAPVTNMMIIAHKPENA